MSMYRKAISALLGAVIVTLAAATSAGGIDQAELVQLVLVATGAFAAYLVPNAPGYSYAKSITSAITAGLSLVAGYLANGQEMTNSLWLNVALAAGVSLGVFIVPNDPEQSISISTGPSTSNPGFRTPG